MNLFNKFKNKKLVFKNNGEIIEHEEYFISNNDDIGNIICLKINGEWFELYSEDENDVIEIDFI